MPRESERDDQTSKAAPDQPTAPHDKGTKTTGPRPVRKPADASADPELSAYRNRLDEQVAARREAWTRTLPVKVDPPPDQPPKPPIPGLARLQGWLREVSLPLAGALVVACVIAGTALWWSLRPEASSAVAGTLSGPAAEIPSDPRELRQALLQERQRGQQLSRDLGMAWRQLTAQANALADRAAQEQELRDLRQVLEHAESNSTDIEQKLSEERERSRQLEEQLAARRDTPTAEKTTQQREIGSLRQSLKQLQDQTAAQELSLGQERDRSRKLEEQLGQAQADLQQAKDQSAAQERAAAQERERRRPLEDQLAALRQGMKQAEERASSQEQLLSQERSRSQRLEQQIATQRQAVVVVADKPAVVATDTAPIAVTPVVTAADADLPRLMMRARLLLSQGDIGAARSVLERAADSGNPLALFALAETFDPNVLSAWGTLGTKGDPARARAFYTKALAGGVLEAKERLSALR